MVQLARSVLHLCSPRWAARSQQQACRNAMVATTAITEARRERVEIEQLVAELLARRAEAASPTLPAARLG